MTTPYTREELNAMDDNLLLERKWLRKLFWNDMIINIPF